MSPTSGRHILAAPAWPYANGPRHIGHVSGFGLPCDMFSRYHRMAGDKVLMVSGTDEHGTPIQVQADAEGVTARELADRYNRVIAEDLTGLGMSYDLFTRTTTQNHYAVVQEIFKGLYDNGYIFAKTTLGAVSPSTGRTLPDRYIEGTCPICGYDSARGDQCDNCQNQLDPVDLINPRSRINGETPVFVETEQFFLDLPAFADVLGSWLQSKSGQWRPNVLKFSLNLLGDLQPRAITRDLDWGVPIPLDGWRDRPDKRIYVWFDAVIGYLSASIEWARQVRRPRRVARLVAVARRPVLLLHGQGQHRLPLRDLAGDAARLQRPGGQGRQARLARRAEPAVGGGVERVPDDGGAQVLLVQGGRHLRPRLPRPLRRRRAALLRGRGRAGEPGHRLHLERVHPPQQRRAGRQLGKPGQPQRLVRRPQHRLDPRRRRADRGRPRDSRALAARRSPAVGESLSRSRFKAAITETMRTLGEANKYLSDQAPWKLRESDPDRMRTILHVALQLVDDGKTLLTPFLPRSSQRVFEMLGGQGVWADMPRIDEVDEPGGRPYPVITGDYSGAATWEPAPIRPGTPLDPPTPLFAKIDPAVVIDELDRLGGYDTEAES